jgi:hypothetical protein
MSAVNPSTAKYKRMVKVIPLGSILGTARKSRIKRAIVIRTKYSFVSKWIGKLNM